MLPRVGIVVTLVFVGAAPLLAQNAANAQNELADPLQCWWRTSASAVRVGEPFSVVLTCAVLETDEAKVIVDQSKLEPSVVQLAPFEVTGGSHGADLRTADRRFFQYEYRLRLIAENLFGKDVPLPETKIGYHVQSRVGQGAAIQGRDQSYVLPAQSIRILSLVPADASDIRDTTTETFADVDQRTFRASVLTVTGGILYALAALMGVLAIVRLVARYRAPSKAADRIVSDGAILRGVGRELASVKRAREDSGWTPALAARALAALRVVAAYGLGRAVSRLPARTADDVDGQFVLRSGWPRGKRIAVSAAVTPQGVAHALAHSTIVPARAALLEPLGDALSRFTTAQYGRDGALDDSALDESLEAGNRALRRLKIDQLWIVKRFSRPAIVSEMESRAWSR